MVDRRHQEVHTGNEGLDADGVLTGDDASVGNGFDDAGPFEVGLVTAVDVEQDPGVGERSELGIAGNERRSIAVDRLMPAEEPEVGVPFPQHPACAGDELFTSWRSAGEERHVDLAILLSASPRVHRWRAPEREVYPRHPHASHEIE